MTCVNAYASTHFELHVPSKPLPYCQFMPFDHVDPKIVIHEVYNRIYVTQPVQLEFSRKDSKPLTGLQLWSPKGRIEPVRAFDTKYLYDLPTLAKDGHYELRGILKFPAKAGFKICVSALSR